MNPMTKSYMFHHWIEDTNEKIELAKQHGYLIGSFTNPEMAKRMMDDADLSVSEEDVEETFNMIVKTREEQERQKELESKYKRRRRTKTNKV